MMDLKTRLLPALDMILFVTTPIMFLVGNQVFHSKLKPLYSAFLHSIKLSNTEEQ